MRDANQIPAGKFECITEAELELLIARYTLEYVYRWTNDFDPAALAGLRKLFDAAGSPEDILRMLRCRQNSLPN